MKSLVIGYGSIGKRHYDILNNINQIDSIDLVSRREHTGITVYSELRKAPINDYDYFVIASETSQHIEQLLYLDSHVFNKKILVEKPIAEEFVEISLSGQNNVGVGYNLRFEPVLVELKRLLDEEKVFMGSVQVGQFLPDWRPGTDYSKSYSAKKAKGGGVLLDLSHEIDYLLWFLGIPVEFYGSCSKVSDLQIETEDSAFLCLTFGNGANVSLTMDYLSKEPIRRLYFHQKSRTILCDLIKREITITSLNGKSDSLNFSCERNIAYEAMHRDFLFSKESRIASFDNGLSVLRIVQQVKNRSRGTI